MTKRPVCVVIGVGPGIGASLARRFAREGYAVALLARSLEHTRALEGELPESRAFACDASDGASIASAFARIRSELGEPEVLLYNAGSGVFGTFEDVSAEQLEQAWKVNTLGLFHASREVIGAMKARGRGTVLVTGATASLRGGARFAAFAQAKAAQRSLAQSMARTLWPSGVHVAVVIVDGMVDLPRTRAMRGDLPQEAFLAPDDVAEAMWTLHRQPRSAWTFELDVRPHVETW
ncbi:SDR family NAD(P)-dependent oxidoreductase [Sandaracinus amylolyticus]|nr:SDR family NAD(P)-dependent oxidoreductase [Sandaracinus amylolyticus]